MDAALGQLVSLVLDGSDNFTIFDTTFGGTDGTPDSALGRDFIFSGTDDSGTATYSKRVKIGANNPCRRPLPDVDGRVRRRYRSPRQLGLPAGHRQRFPGDLGGSGAGQHRPRRAWPCRSRADAPAQEPGLRDFSVRSKARREPGFLFCPCSAALGTSRHHPRSASLTRPSISSRGNEYPRRPTTPCRRRSRTRCSPPATTRTSTFWRSTTPTTSPR